MKPKQQLRDLLLLSLLLTTFIASAWAYSAIVPPYENQDEIEHAEVVRHIATTGKLPVHGQAEAAGYATRQESSQPPLYHILAAGWIRLWGLPLDANDWMHVPGEVVACGDPQTLYSKATWANNPDRAASAPQVRTLRTERLFSILLATGGLAGLFILARRVFPKGLAPAFVVAIVAFSPQFLFISSGVNNDNLMTALAMWGMLLAFDLWDQGPTLKRVLLMSVLAGLGGLTKLSGVGLVGLGGLAILLYALRTRMPFGKLVLWGVVIVLPAVLIVSPWLWRNYRLYGDPTALRPMLEKVLYRDYPMDWWEAWIMVRSYWAQVPCSFYPRAVYWPFFLLLGGGLSGAGLHWWRFDKRLKGLMGLSVVWFVVITLAWLRWNMTTPSSGGRLLFPASGALALILVAGWHGLAPRSVKWWAAVLPVLALISLRAGPMAIFGRPPGMDTLPTGVTAVDYEFGDALALRGYAVNVETSWWRCVLVSSDYCRSALDFTLVWEQTAPLEENWTLVTQLVSPVPGETNLRFNMNRWPGHGNMPTSTLPDGLILDHYVVPLAEWSQTQAWSFQVDFTLGGQRIPLTEGGVGTTAYLDVLRVPLIEGTEPAPELLEGTFTVFEDSLSVIVGDVSFADDAMSFDLHWTAAGQPAQDYSVFIHAYADDGSLVAAADNPPGHLAFPMSLMVTGDHHSYRAMIPHDGAGVSAIAFGLYDPATGVRVPVIESSALRVESDAVIIWEPGE